MAASTTNLPCRGVSQSGHIPSALMLLCASRSPPQQKKRKSEKMSGVMLEKKRQDWRVQKIWEQRVM